ncbi:hypothetical protein ACEWY4_022147 [Coilia grayii]|uniref:Uncharacterized protein n=1 Tax=Coilia grayii TaxID=363190 RepID=A0ABD1J683_9TELE
MNAAKTNQNYRTCNFFHVLLDLQGRGAIREQIQQLSHEAAWVFADVGLDESEILTLSKQDLNELLPGTRNFKIRRRIAELINSAKQESPESSDSLVTRLRDLISRDDVKNSPVASAVLEDYLHILRDTEKQLASSLDLLRQHVKQLEDLRRPPQGHPSAVGPAAACPVGPVRNETHPRLNRTTTASPVKIHLLVCGKTLGFHADLLRRVGVPTQEVDVEQCQVVLLFCPVYSRAGTDIDAALSAVPGNKDAVMVIMHYTYYPQQSLTRTNASYPDNICTVVHIFFHDSGLLNCDSNRQALADIEAALKTYTAVQ